MKTIAILNAKGGVGKTVLSHLLCRILGEVGYSPSLLQTDARDEETPWSVPGRPYVTFALRPHRDPDQAIRDYEKFREGIQTIANSIMVIDGGANRRNVDTLVSEAADLIIVPVGISEGDMIEAVGTFKRIKEHRASKGLKDIPIRYALSNWPGERRKLAVVARARHVAAFYRASEGHRFNTIITNMPSIISLMDSRKPIVNNTLRRMGKELATEVCEALDIPTPEQMFERMRAESEMA